MSNQNEKLWTEADLAQNEAINRLTHKMADLNTRVETMENLLAKMNERFTKNNLVDRVKALEARFTS